MGLPSLLDSQQWIDETAERVQRTVRSAFDGLGPARGAIKNALHGTWLGHPLHPVLTDIPLGAWTATVVLDDIAAHSSNPGIARASDVTLTLGLIGAAGAAVTGVADWTETDARPRRMGFGHAALNIGATVLFAGSLLCRRQGSRTAGRLMAAMGYLIAVAAAYLGGELVSQEQIGVNHSAGRELPEEFTPMLPEGELSEGQLKRARYKETAIMLARRGGQVYALVDTCAHLGGPLSEGKLEGDTVVCPWHGSRFALDSGAVVDGPSVFPQPCLEVRTRDGNIEVRKSRAADGTISE